MTSATSTSPTPPLPAMHWVISAELEVLSPLHVGTGTDRRIDPNLPAGANTSPHDDVDDAPPNESQPYWQADLARDHAGKPYIPGASLKGAFRALARRLNLDASCLALFGEINRGVAISPAGTQPQRTLAGLAEFRDALQSHVISTAGDQDTVQARIAIDRVTGSVADKKLFHTEVVPKGTRFHVEIILRWADATLAARLVALINAIADDPQFALGAHTNLGLGQIGLYGQVHALRFGPDEAQAWFAAAQADPDACWTRFARPTSLPAVQAAEVRSPRLLKLPLSLKFHTPFLVKHPVPKAGKSDNPDPDGIPRQQGDRVLLPGASLRGRLRSQAERILRTLGCPVAQGHDVPPVKGCQSPDPATLLFGAAGWRGVLRTTPCVGTETLHPVDHDMLAIDRFTGGGKDGAKFKIRYAECPTLEGGLELDLDRLHHARLDGEAHDDNACWIALGLLTLVLRDLSEGDIPFGYGHAKGYGRCRAERLLPVWRTHITRHFGPDADSKALDAFRAWCAANATQPLEAPTPLANDAPPAQATFQPTAVTNGFHNPYHFIPFSQPDIQTWLSPEAHRETGGHNRYRGLSGRLVCALDTVTPLFIGAAARTPESDRHPKPVDGFTLQNQPAIPATSLRGMLSSLFESLSGSNLRVLHPSPYSMRKSTKEALSAIGRIVEHDGELKLYPLTLPTLRMQGNDPLGYTVPSRWQKVFYWESPIPLRVYFGNRRETYDASRPHYFPLRELSFHKDHVGADNRDLRFPSRDQNKTLLIGQRPMSSHERPITEADFLTKSPQEQARYTRGWVRTLWTRERDKDLPGSVKHLLFIPDPVETPAAADLLPLPPAVVDTFHALADQALASQHWGNKDTPPDAAILPFTPAGRTRDKGRKTRLQHGDLVCFDLDDDSRVREIAFSSVWRQGIRMPGAPRLATTADLLAQVSPDLLPFGMAARSPRLSPVEQLFGVVEDRPRQPAKGRRKATSAPAAYALAGKVYIGFGRPTPDHTVKRDPPVTLKELSTPKPPSPAFYFRPKVGDGYLSKADLSRKPTQYVPAGRKHYLHALRRHGEIAKLDARGRVPADSSGLPPWESCFNGQEDSGNKRRVRVEPIAAEETFRFEIDFANLSPAELEMLCATLLPAPSFEHRLGMGKPIGLGSVKLAVEGLFIVDRTRRYAHDPLDAPRHHQGWRANGEASWPTHLQDGHPASALEPTPSPAILAARALAGVAPAVRRALQLLGNPGAVAVPVHYPQVNGGQLENKHYSWFMENDKQPSNNGYLPGFTGSSTHLPTLTRLEETKTAQGKPHR